MAMHKSARNDPNAGQVNLEQPLNTMITEYQAAYVQSLTATNAALTHQIELQEQEITELRGRVRQLEEEVLKAYYDGRAEALIYDPL